MYQSNNSPHQNGSRSPMDPQEEYQRTPNSAFNYFEDDDNYDEQHDGSYQQQHQQSTPLYSPHVEEPPSLSPYNNNGSDAPQDNSGLGYPLPLEDYGEDNEQSSAIVGEDAALETEELEQLQEEAERMKGLGNKHMAAQEYTRAYNAYSAALQLSPVGPSSHVFLSNRAASLLSLKRYSAAAVDARRAVALAPTFGKAYARLGQALYFLKQYQGAVEAYEDALRYEQDGSNGCAVTKAYLIKAKEKLVLQEEKERRKLEAGEGGGNFGCGDDGGTVGEESALQTVAYSVVTDKDGRGVASGRINSERLGQVAKDEKDKQMSPIGEDRVENENAAVVRGSPVSPYDEPTNQKRASPTMMYVETGPMGGPAQRRVGAQDGGLADDGEIGDGNDPDFDEALLLQQRATKYLTHKKYRQAVDDFSAALFLVPDDPILTPQLHVGRAHALNGQERFDSAKNDALMALRHILRNGEEDVSAAEAYSVLGKSLYYTKDYQGAIEALEECDRVWKLNGGKLSVFDEAYLEQCHQALDAGLGIDHADGASVGGGASVTSLGVKSVVSTLKEGKPLSNIPKLKPPRFVSREEALRNAHDIPPMPKKWPQQSPTSPSSVATGPERKVTFLSDAMGIKLNRGNDGLIRVISVANLPPGSPILRKGSIETGDLVREAGGVDLRRPITAVMWSDTVALIKMAPRPLIVIVAKEITAELGNGASPQKFDYSSAAIGEESVAESVCNQEVMREIGTVHSNSASEIESGRTPSDDSGAVLNTRAESEVSLNDSADTTDEGKTPVTAPTNITRSDDLQNETPGHLNAEIVETAPICVDKADHSATHTNVDAQPEAEGKLSSFDDHDKSNSIDNVTPNAIEDVDDSNLSSVDPNDPSVSEEITSEHSPLSLNKGILFDDHVVTIQAFDDGSDEAKAKRQGWTNNRWAAAKPTLKFFGPVYKAIQEKKMFWSQEKFHRRTLAIFSLAPSNLTSAATEIILLLRNPTDAEEVIRLMPTKRDSNPISKVESEALSNSFLVAENAIEPMACKLKLSQLTTPTSIPLDHNSSKKLDRRAFFELITPAGSIKLSAAPIVSEKDTDLETHYNINAIIETTKFEDAISDMLLTAHALTDNTEDAQRAGTHQVILGTLHSYVISGNDKMLSDALNYAIHLQKSNASDGPTKLDSTIIDARDLNWKTPLHYACERKRPTTVSLLINAGADPTIPTHDALTPLHLCSERLDDKCLSIILSATHHTRPDPNVLDSLGRTPMYLAAVNGNDAPALSRCLSALNAWGGQLLPTEETAESKRLLHPIHFISSQWKHEQLETLLSNVSHRFPLVNSELGSVSLGAKYGYPIHATVISLRFQIQSSFHRVNKDSLTSSGGNRITRTIQTLVDHGFEPNERFEGIVGDGKDIKQLGQYFGFTPIQILAATAIEFKSINDNMETMSIIQLTSNVLFKNGARIKLPDPPTTRLDRETPPGCFSLQESLEYLTLVDSPAISRQVTTDDVTSLFGGKEQIKASQTCFTATSQITLDNNVNIQMDLSSVLDSDEPGGSDANSCAICWSEFGVISNRKQFCQVSTRNICGDCSRLVEGASRPFDFKASLRVSDGQFLLAKALAAKKKNISSNRITQQASVGKTHDHNQEYKNRVSLGLFNKLSSLGGAGENSDQSTNEKISSAVSNVNQARDAILERGSKLEGLAEKTEALSNTSLEFANLAKELNRQQNSWW